MIPKEYVVKNVQVVIRPAEAMDAEALSALRLKADEETPYLDREPGEAYLDADQFRQVIEADTARAGSCLFLVAEANGRLAGFCRCEGKTLERFRHQAEFGVMILEEFWGLGIGSRLLEHTLHWADTSGILKVTLHVAAVNGKAAELYRKHGFEVEGVLRQDRRFRDDTFSDTIVMGRLAPTE